MEQGHVVSQIMFFIEDLCCLHLKVYGAHITMRWKEWLEHRITSHSIEVGTRIQISVRCPICFTKLQTSHQSPSPFWHSFFCFLFKKLFASNFVSWSFIFIYNRKSIKNIDQSQKNSPTTKKTKRLYFSVFSHLRVSTML